MRRRESKPGGTPEFMLTSVRLSKADQRRADAVAEALSAVIFGVTVTRSEVLRRAIDYGLEVFETEMARGRGRR